MTEIKRNSTVAIAPEDVKRLEYFCKANKITKKDFISLSLTYFELQGINPAKHESPKAEMEKVIKRLDQFFAFFKKQEQDILRPMYADMVGQTNEIKNTVDEITDSYKSMSDSLRRMEKRFKFTLRYPNDADKVEDIDNIQLSNEH